MFYTNEAWTKCLVVAPNARRISFKQLDDYPFFNSNKPIEFAKSFAHLGHIMGWRWLPCIGDVTILWGINDMLCYFKHLGSCFFKE
jgi:hypothetical protein